MALSRKVYSTWLGRMSYADGLALQHRLVNSHKNGSGQNTLLMLEHSPTYTVGKRGAIYDESFEEYLKSLGADFHRVNRGGLITFHGPGQLVAYPILQLEKRNAIRWYVDRLEDAIIDLLSEFNLKGEKSPHTGVWIGDNKICAMGINAEREITSHGLAINCNTEMKWFGNIVPCGIADKGVTSLTRELDREVDCDEVRPVLIEKLSKHLKIPILPLEQPLESILSASTL